MKNPPKSLLRQIRRNNVAVVWNNFEEKLDFQPIPKRKRSVFYRLRRNQEAMNNAKKFMLNPSKNPITGEYLKKRLGKKLFNFNN